MIAGGGYGTERRDGLADGSSGRTATARAGCAEHAIRRTYSGGLLRPGGRFVFSLSHPLRWCLPDDPGPGGLVVRDSYFDRTPYVEQDPAGQATYVEHHRTLGDRVREVTAAGLRLVDLVEPEWEPSNDQTWGGWSPLRGALVPGTAIFVCEKG